jgi:predicted enzyme related to lactoylglutathione lyase
MTSPDFIEIGTTDPSKTTAFFKDVMGWDWAEMREGGGYFTDGTRKVGLHTEDTPCMVPYLPVSDIKSVVARVLEAGGTLMGEITTAEELGVFATCVDPSGVRFGLFQERM